jgi:TP901 family phage tail tape measure protein
MNVLVRIQADKALAQLARLRGGIAGVDSGMGQVNKRELIGQRHIGALSKFGNQLQWTGRMLQYNFTLPIVLAGAAATKFALDQEKAFTHVAKVYGDTHAAAAQFRKEMGLGQQAAENMANSIKTDELEALDRAFTALSNHYGVQKKEVNEIAGAWAAAGASGRDLAESVRATMDAMIIGDMKSADATKALISIQAQYNLSTSQLTETLAAFNSIENATGASMSDLIVGMEKAAGVARSAGIETGQLAAYMAALVPATGTAATAGNALKTIISRLVAPTKESSQVMKAMGHDVEGFAWQSMTATERIQAMAERFDELSSSQKNAAASVIASRWQVNRFDVLMREVINTQGYYAKALEASKDAGDNFTRMQDELNTVLESNPRKLQRMMVIIQNAAVEVIQPLIPHIIYLAQSLAKAAQAFADLDPHVQKLVLILVLLLAAVGPVVRYMGALTTLAGVLGKGFQLAAHGVLLLAGGLLKALLPLRLLGVLASATFLTIAKGFTVFFTALVSGTAFGMAKSVALFVGGLAAKASAFATWAALQITMLKGFWGRFLTLWTSSIVLAGGRWAAFMLLLLTFAQRGLAALAARFFAATLVIKAVTWMGAGVVAAWQIAMRTVVLVTVGGTIAMSKIWGAAAIAGTGLWSRFAATFVVIHRGMWALTIALSRASWITMLAIYNLGGKALLTSVRAMALRIIPILLGPWGIAIAAIVGLLYTFRTQIAQIWSNITSDVGSIGDVFSNIGHTIMGVFNSLPEGVQRAMIAVVTVVRDAALAVYDWFSYINPFARHSPSLVENVTNGMGEVNRQFATLSNIKKYTTAAYAEIKRFGQLTAQLGISARAAQQAEDRATLKKAGAGQALGSYNRLVGILNKLTPILKKLESQMASQQRVVDAWQAKVDEANRKLDIQQAKLDKLQGVLDGYKDKLSEAEDALAKFASTPIEGMREMEEQIFANQMAQLKLRDEMMKMEDVYGTFDQLKAKIDAINGAQEVLRGTQSELRAAGAGSEILSQYDDELAKLDQQKDSYKDAADKLADMQAALDALQRQAERLDLTKALKFDEMLHQIEMAANRMEELPFEDIMAGIAGANAQIDKYGPKVDAATAAVAAQQAVVDQLTQSRDALNVKLEQEQAKLDRLKEKYDSVNDAIQAINSSLQDVLSSSDKLTSGGKKGGKGGSEYMSPGLQNFLNAKGAGFPDPGGAGIPPRSDWSSQAGDIDKFTDQLSKDTSAAFGSLNPFEPLKKKAGQAWDWIKNKASQVAGSVGDFFENAFSGVSIDGGGGLGKFFEKLQGIGEWLTEVFRDVAKVFKWAWDLLGPEVIKIGEGIWNGLKDIWESVGPELAKFGELFAPMGEAISNIWTILKPILAVIVGALLGLAKVVLAVFADTIRPILAAVGDVLAGLIRIIRGVIKVIVGLFTLDFGMMFGGILDIVGGTFDAIWGIIKGAGKVIWGVVKGIVRGIAGFFHWLWDVLVGHSIVPDIIEGIVFWFKKLVSLAKWVWDKVLVPIFNFFKWAFTKIIGLVKLWWAGIKLAWAGLMTAGQWIWDNVLTPIWTAVTNIFNNFIKPAFQLWWAGIKLVWAGLRTAGRWIWNNVLRPIWNKVADLWPLVKAAFGRWWTGIQRIWNVLKTLGSWMWNNVLKPVWTKATDLWVKVKGSFSGWFEGIKKVWNTLTGLGKWVWDNVMSPVVTKIKSAWNSIKKWLEDNADMLGKPMRGIVNVVISAVNAIINGLNGVSKILPGIDWHIEPIKKLAQGGEVPRRRGNRGFKTTGARAIVGEGKANWPEFVIPTDPTHRNRAKGLLAMAASKIGGMGDSHNIKNSAKRIGGVPAYDIGGWFGDRWDDTKKLAGKGGKLIADLGKGAVGKIMWPAIATAKALNNRAKWTPARTLGKFGIEKATAWTKATDADVDGVWRKATKAQQTAGGGANIAVSDPSNPRGKTNYKGGIFTNRFVAHMQAAERAAGEGIRVMQGGFRPKTSYSGTSHQGDALDLQPSAKLIRALRRVGIAAGDRTGLGNWGPHAHAVPGPRAGYGAGSAVWQWQDYVAKGGKSQPLNSAWGLANGAIVKARRGGVSARIGEGLNDEAIVPLPRDYRSNLLNKGTDSGKKEYNFYGDLSFPNITDPADAKTFLENLDALAKD